MVFSCFNKRESKCAKFHLYFANDRLNKSPNLSSRFRKAAKASPKRMNHGGEHFRRTSLETTFKANCPLFKSPTSLRRKHNISALISTSICFSLCFEIWHESTLHRKKQDLRASKKIAEKAQKTENHTKNIFRPAETCAGHLSLIAHFQRRRWLAYERPDADIILLSLCLLPLSALCNRVLYERSLECSVNTVHLQSIAADASLSLPATGSSRPAKGEINQNHLIDQKSQ